MKGGLWSSIPLVGVGVVRGIGPPFYGSCKQDSGIGLVA